jgi:hypothetical protein
MIRTTKSNIHWNYYLALEKDLEVVSRYIEFVEPNFAVYSIELARLLFAAASETDVVAQRLCKFTSPDLCKTEMNINDYKAILKASLPTVIDTEVFVPRYGLSFKPWINWAGDENPKWWRSYNKVKHNRDESFDQATLQNVLNALGALLILTLNFYSFELADGKSPLHLKGTTFRLQPESRLLRLKEEFYQGRGTF